MREQGNNLLPHLQRLKPVLARSNGLPQCIGTLLQRLDYGIRAQRANTIRYIPRRELRHALVAQQERHGIVPHKDLLSGRDIADGVRCQHLNTRGEFVACVGVEVVPGIWAAGVVDAAGEEEHAAVPGCAMAKLDAVVVPNGPEPRVAIDVGTSESFKQSGRNRGPVRTNFGAIYCPLYSDLSKDEILDRMRNVLVSRLLFIAVERLHRLDILAIKVHQVDLFNKVLHVFVIAH